MKNQIWTIIGVAVIIAIISSVATAAITGEVIKVKYSNSGSSVYTKEEVDNLLAKPSITYTKAEIDQKIAQLSAQQGTTTTASTASTPILKVGTEFGPATNIIGQKINIGDQSMGFSTINLNGRFNIKTERPLDPTKTLSSLCIDTDGNLYIKSGAC